MARHSRKRTLETLVKLEVSLWWEQVDKVYKTCEGENMTVFTCVPTQIFEEG